MPVLKPFDPYPQAVVPDTPPTKLTIEKLRFLGAVEFGSRALGVDKGNADYDFAMLRTVFDKLVEGDTTTEIHWADVGSYFKIVPAFAKCSMVVTYTTAKTDILLFERQSDLDIIAKSVEDLKALPRYMVVNKQRRVALYQEALLRNGFVYSNWKQRLRYLPMRIVNLFKA